MSLSVEKLQIGDILLKKGHVIGAEIIRALTADGVPVAQSHSHSGIYAGDGKVYDARFPGGVGLYDLDYGDYDAYRPNLSPAQEWQSDLIEYCKAKVGTRYAVEELLKQALELGLHIPMHVHFGANGEECSYFVAEAFRHIGFPLTNKPLPVPNDLGWSVAVTQIKE